MRSACYAIIVIGVGSVILVAICATKNTPLDRRTRSAQVTTTDVRATRSSIGVPEPSSMSNPSETSPGPAPSSQDATSDGDLLRLAREEAASSTDSRAGRKLSKLARLLQESGDAAARAIDLIASDAIDDATRRSLRGALPSRKEHPGWNAALTRLAMLGPRLADPAARLRLTDSLGWLLRSELPDPRTLELLTLWARSERQADVRTYLLHALRPTALRCESVRRLILDASMSAASVEERAVADGALGTILEAGGQNAAEVMAHILRVGNDPHESPLRRSVMFGALFDRSQLRDYAKPYRQQLVDAWSQALRNPSEDPFLRRSAFARLQLVDASRALDLASEVLKNDSDTDFRRYVFGQLDRLPTSPRLVQVLVDGLMHPTFDSQQSSALLALQERGDESALPALESLVNDPKLGASARAAIQRIKTRSQASK